MDKFQIVCPCCDTSISVDAATGAVLGFEEKKKSLGTFEDLKSDLEKKSVARDQMFQQEQKAQNERARLLDEKFNEAVKKADTDSTEPFRNPLDFD